MSSSVFIPMILVTARVPDVKAAGLDLAPPTEPSQYCEGLGQELAGMTCQYCPKVLLTIWIPKDLSKHSFEAHYHSIFYAMMATDQLSDVFVASAFLHFINFRRDSLGRAYGDEKPLSSYSISSAKKKRILDTVLLSSMTLVIKANFIVGAVLTRTLPNPDPAYVAYANLYHAYIAFYIAATMNVTLSALFLWNSLTKTVASPEKITRVVLKHICPLLIVRVLFKLSVDIITSLPTTFDIDFDVLGLVEAIVESVTYTAVLNMSSSLVRPTGEGNKGEKLVGDED
ncbi:hypothetical protein D9615_005607 [Tricholomella constricta]|uniref:Uncharacterized protein n=1 Tax=Tricholomella constricta TaxID=117010 RepID=A0A8H5HEE5_9AGAR|nr:hypothetical protein D9615_005607 [Tricholomella constricta]